MNKEEAIKIQEYINSSDKIYLFLHLSPDGDSLGSNVAFKSYLESLGKNVVLACHDLPPVQLMNFLGLSPEYFLHEDPFNINFSNEDLLITLDSAASDRISKNPEFKNKILECNVVNIDHHEVKENFAKFNVIHPDRASTTVLVHEYFNHIEHKRSLLEINAIALGIFTDTGGFTNFNTTSYVFEIMRDLLDSGAEYEKLQISVNSKDELYFKTIAKIYSNIVILGEKNLAYTSFSLKDRLELRLPVEFEIGELSNHLKGIQGNFDFVAAFTELEENYTKISLRSVRSDFNVEEIAKKHGGGGHKAAAGARLNENLENTIKIFLDSVK